MALFLLSGILIVIFFYNIRLFIFSLVIFFVLFDMFDGFYKDDKIYAAIRYVIPLTLLGIYMIKNKVMKIGDSIILYASIYLILLLIVNSSDFLVSARGVVSLIITLLFIPIGKNLCSQTDFIKDFKNYNRFLLYIIPVYIIIANILGIGESYTEAFSTGFLVTSRMYVVPMIVFLGFHYLVSDKQESLAIKSVDSFFILLNICILLINTRRTTLAMLLGAIIIYTFFNRHLALKMITALFVVVMALIVSFPLYEDRLMAQLEKRERIQNIDSYEEEGRYLETHYIIQFHEKRDNLQEVLFGVKPFDTYDFGTKFFGRDRPIHSDINMFFYSTGIVGLLIFTAIFIIYFFIGNKNISNTNKSLYYSFLFMFLLVLIPGRFIGTLTFAPFLMLLLTSIKYQKSETTNPENIQTPATASNNYFNYNLTVPSVKP